MSLSALKDVDASVAKGALASTVMSMAGPGLEFVPEQYSSLSKALIAEARKALKISADDDSDRSFRAIRAFLSKEVDRQIYAGVDRDSLRDKLSASGNLPLAGYSIEFSSDFDEGFKEDRRFVEKTMRSADRIEHRVVGIAEKMKLDRGSSLFAKIVLSKDRSRNNILLVDAIRAGTTLSVTKTWRIFPEVIDLESEKSPFELLDRFVSHYGFDVEYEGYARGKLISNLELPAELNDPDATDQIRRVHSQRKNFVAVESGTNVTMHKEGVESHVETFVLLAYAIDIDRYRSDARRFG